MKEGKDSIYLLHHPGQKLETLSSNLKFRLQIGKKVYVFNLENQSIHWYCHWVRIFTPFSFTQMCAWQLSTSTNLRSML